MLLRLRKRFVDVCKKNHERKVLYIGFTMLYLINFNRHKCTLPILSHSLVLSYAFLLLGWGASPLAPSLRVSRGRISRAFMNRIVSVSIRLLVSTFACSFASLFVISPVTLDENTRYVTNIFPSNEFLSYTFIESVARNTLNTSRLIKKNRFFLDT